MPHCRGLGSHVEVHPSRVEAGSAGLRRWLTVLTNPGLHRLQVIVRDRSGLDGHI